MEELMQIVEGNGRGCGDIVIKVNEKLNLSSMVR